MPWVEPVQRQRHLVRCPAPGSAADVYNFLKVTVTGTTVEVDPTNAAGNVFDRQVYTFAPRRARLPPRRDS